MSTPEDYRQTWYEDAMASREQELGRVLGPTSPKDQVFKPADQNLELTVPGFAFLRFPPAPTRSHWLYVTHGLSQPTEFDEFCNGFTGQSSGLGVEFALATASEESWPFNLLELLAKYALGGSKPILPGDRIPSSDLMEEARGGGLLALPTPAFAEFKTLSGHFDVIHFVGITAGELKKAKTHPGHVGSQILEQVLQDFGIGGVTDRKRACATTNPKFDRVWLDKSLKVKAS